MNLYHIYRTGKIGYDELAGAVVAANSEEEARRLVTEVSGDEARDFDWEKTRFWEEAREEVTAILIGAAMIRAFDKPGIVCQDFRAG